MVDNIGDRPGGTQRFQLPELVCILFDKRCPTPQNPPTFPGRTGCPAALSGSPVRNLHGSVDIAGLRFNQLFINLTIRRPFDRQSFTASLTRLAINIITGGHTNFIRIKTQHHQPLIYGGTQNCTYKFKNAL